MTKFNIAAVCLMFAVCGFGAFLSTEYVDRMAPRSHKMMSAMEAAPMLEKATAAATSTGIQALMDKIGQITLDDLQNAKAIADAHHNTVSSSCWAAFITHFQADQVAVKDATGAPIAAPKIHLISDAEKAVDLVNDLSSTGPVGTACAALVNQTRMSAVSLVTALAGGTFLTMMPMPPMPVPVP